MTYNLAVGTFDKSLLYTLQFKLKQNTLSIISSFESPGPHSWLSLNVGEPDSFYLSHISTLPEKSLISSLIRKLTLVFTPRIGPPRLV